MPHASRASRIAVCSGNHMASAPPLNGPERTGSSFAEALHGLAAGSVSLGYTRQALAAALAAGGPGASGARSLIAAAWEDGHLSAEDYEALAADLGHDLREDDPTEWSDALVSEFAPTGDTAQQQPDAAGHEDGQPRVAPLAPDAVLRERFVLHSQVDTSGMSEVYKALDRRRQEAGAANPWIAIKLVAPACPRYREALRLLQREAALAQRLEHPHIVRVFDFDRDGDHAFITMEWLEGESLAALLTRQQHRPLAGALARQILTEVADALQFAHSCAITHADVKPGNIFLTREGPVKLLDFGVARDGDEQATDARTPAYASCEVLEGQSPTPQDDVYALACVAYRMLAGRRVFGHDDALGAERAGRRPARIHRLTDGQWQALAQALALRREARTADVAGFIQAFNATPAPAAPVITAATVANAVPPARRRPAWLALGAGVALVALALILWRSPAPAPQETATTTPPRDAPTGLVGPPLPEPIVAPVAPASRKSATAPAARASKNTSPPRDERPTDRAPETPATPLATAPSTTRGSADITAPQSVTPAVAASAAGPAIAPAVSVAPPALPPAPGTATAAPTLDAPSTAPVTPPIDAPPPPGLREVALASLKFRRYVEPRPRWRNLEPDPAGWVDLSFVVDAQGKTRDVTVTDASPAGRYDEAASAAVRRWRFEPVTEGGQPVERRSAVRLRFEPE